VHSWCRLFSIGAFKYVNNLGIKPEFDNVLVELHPSAKWTCAASASVREGSAVYICQKPQCLWYRVHIFHLNLSSFFLWQACCSFFSFFRNVFILEKFFLNFGMGWVLVIARTLLCAMFLVFFFPLFFLRDTSPLKKIIWHINMHGWNKKWN